VESKYFSSKKRNADRSLAKVEGDLQRALTFPKDNKPGKAATQ
jgi:hypothetical protein